jgi:hypothetical protein
MPLYKTSPAGEGDGVVTVTVAFAVAVPALLDAVKVYVVVTVGNTALPVPVHVPMF